MVDRLINETETVVLLPAYEVNGVVNVIMPTGLVPMSALTAAAINRYAVVTTLAHANAGAGGNVSCALVSSGFTLHLTDSTKDDEKTLCDPANATDLTDLNYDAEMSGFRDADPSATDSVFNLWRSLTFAPDVPYVAVHRIGYSSDVAFAVGQEIDAYFVYTDWPVDVHADGGKLKISEKFVPKSDAKITYTLAA